MSDSKRSGYYEFDLDMQLQTFVGGYEAERAAFLEKRLESEEWTAVKQLREDADSIAVSIRARATALRNFSEVSDINAIRDVYLVEADDARQHFDAMIEGFRAQGKVSPELAAELLKAYGSREDAEDDYHPPSESDRPLRLIWERLCIDDAWEVVLSIQTRVERVFELDRLVRDVLNRQDPPAACIQFLGLVSRCYVFGFVPECVAMCRSAIEQAFKDTVSAEHCERAGKHPVHGEFDLNARIQAAFDPRSKMLTRQHHEHIYQAADRVKWRGNKVLHEQADATKDALGTIKNTLLVIDALSGFANSSKPH